MEPIDPVPAERPSPLPVHRATRVIPASRDGGSGGGGAGGRRQAPEQGSEDAVEVVIEGVAAELDPAARGAEPPRRIDLQA